MKTAVLPHIRVEPEFREEAENLLREGESLTAFMEASFREAVRERKFQAAFEAEAGISWDEYQRTGEGFSAREVADDLREGGAAIIEQRFGKAPRKVAKKAVA